MLAECESDVERVSEKRWVFEKLLIAAYLQHNLQHTYSSPSCSHGWVVFF